MARGTNELTPDELRQRGYKALVKELGAAGAIGFMMQMQEGKGDYTKARQKWVDLVTLEEIMNGIEEMRQNKR